MNDRDSSPAAVGEPGFSLVRNDLLFRLQRKVGLVPAAGLGVVRRALFWSLLAWLPEAIWALATGHFAPNESGESLLQHFGVNVRCLVAIPLLIFAEGFSHKLTTSLMPYFESSGLVSSRDVSRFRGILRDVAVLRDAIYPWVFILALTISHEALPLAFTDLHDLSWATDGGDLAQFGFGGWWYLHVARGIFLVLLLAWLWRVILLTLLFLRISRLDLELVPTHPDGAGGLAFLEHYLKAFSPVVLAISSVAAGKWAHDVLYHGTNIEAIKVNMIGLAIALTVVFLSPFLVWAGKLYKAKKQALLEYGALVGEQGRLVRRRWIEKLSIEHDALLSAPELGPASDTALLYGAAKKMRLVPLSRAYLLVLLIPIALPMLAVATLQFPIKQILMTLFKTLA